MSIHEIQRRDFPRLPSFSFWWSPFRPPEKCAAIFLTFYLIIAQAVYSFMQKKTAAVTAAANTIYAMNYENYS